jgi:hypothetical protein
MDAACVMNGVMRNAYKILVENMKERDYLGDSS